MLTIIGAAVFVGTIAVFTVFAVLAADWVNKNVEDGSCPNRPKK